ncbi:MAG: UDP-N-acetylglucosamine--N-acetylmuramyl-(pentapeptide) pyrophosphoryl-undecaprenol N-acetylglucosamine transferase [Planctomycetota bacterium]|nr:UDP-N-acetylglucosamine--N-acetylmuramyl-(pentapeptide) pyrophosphoryl-undecaprenol N-acetylglucosamine transferase [Planctomycetota bacterium]
MTASEHKSHSVKNDGAAVTVAFAGGGTGGHLAPGMAVAEELSDQYGARIRFYGTGRPAEKRMLEGTGYRWQVLPASPPGRNPKAWMRFLKRNLQGISLCARKYFQEERPDILVGLGGYGSVPAAVAALEMGIPIVLLEQNVLPGRANRFLARWADVFVTQWEESRTYLESVTRKARKNGSRLQVVCLGNPLRRGILPSIDRLEARRRLGLDPHRPTLLIAGGSQGAHSINRRVLEALPVLKRLVPRLQYIHLTGERDYIIVKGAFQKASLSSFSSPYLQDMGLAYRASDFALTRAGATTLAELALARIPAMLVPYPQSADDHQKLNARLFAQAGAGVFCAQSELTATRLTRFVQETLSHADLGRSPYQLGLEDMSRPTAATDVAQLIVALKTAKSQEKKKETRSLARQVIRALETSVARAMVRRDELKSHGGHIHA